MSVCVNERVHEAKRGRRGVSGPRCESLVRAEECGPHLRPSDEARKNSKHSASLSFIQKALPRNRLCGKHSLERWD